MPIFVPILIAVAATSGVSYGGFRGFRAKGRIDQARLVARNSDGTLAAAQADFDKANEQLVQAAKLLGQTRLQTQAVQMARFADTLGRVKDIRIKPISFSDLPELPTALEQIRTNTTIARDLLGGVVGAVTTGTGVYLGATSVIGAVGNASTGTALYTLSGAAATKATAAYAGGGALSAGGFGAAVGTALLGFLGIGAAATVAGIAADVHAEKRLTAEVEAAARKEITAAELRLQIVLAGGLERRALEVVGVIERLAALLDSLIADANDFLLVREQLAAEQRQRLSWKLVRFEKLWAPVRWMMRMINLSPKLPPDPLKFNNLDVLEQRAIETLCAVGIAAYQVLKLELVDELGESNDLAFQTVIQMANNVTANGVVP